MTEKKRMVVVFDDDDWQKIQLLKQKYYSVSYSEMIRQAVSKGIDTLMSEEPRKDPA